MKELIETAKNVLAISWCVSSFGTPFLATAFVCVLGSSVDIRGRGECGGLINTKTNETFNPVTPFERDVEEASGSFPWLVLYGPLSIPISLYFVTTSTFHFACHVWRMR